MYPEDCVVPSQSADSDVSTLPDSMESELMHVREQTSFYVPFQRRWSHDDRVKQYQGERRGGGWEEREEERGRG